MLEGLTKCEDDLLDVPSYGNRSERPFYRDGGSYFVHMSTPHCACAEKTGTKKQTVVRPKPVRPGRLRRPSIVRFSGTCKVESSTPGEPAAFFDSENVEVLVLKGSIKLCAEFANFIESQDVATL